MPLSLKVALLHMAVTHKDPTANRKVLLTLIDKAAGEGAQLIPAPEMALSGYSFDHRGDIAPYTEAVDGPTLTQIGERARLHGVFICVGLALSHPSTGIFTNSAVAVDPDGRVVCRYDKINAEGRWACPGDPRRNNTFETPWGRMGILIFSDTYHSLLPRVTALRKVDLLLVPANWPPTGINPKKDAICLSSLRKKFPQQPEYWEVSEPSNRWRSLSAPTTRPVYGFLPKAIGAGGNQRQDRAEPAVLL